MQKFYKKANLKTKYYTTDNTYSASDYGLPNCTCYAYGRVYESSGKKPKWVGNPYKNSSNLSIWNSNDGFKKSQTPKVGSVAIFDNGDTGHVAFVEWVHSNGDIDISDSAYKDYDYQEYTLKKSENYKHKFGELVGFKETFSTQEKVKKDMFNKTYEIVMDLKKLKYSPFGKKYYVVKITKKRNIYHENGKKTKSVLNVGDLALVYVGKNLKNGDKTHHFISNNGQKYYYVSGEKI